MQTRRMAVAALVGAVLAAPGVASADPATAVTRSDADVAVTNPGDGETYDLDGFVVGPDGCEPTTAILLLHGLSYTGESWDVAGYSWTRMLAARGYDVYAIDRLGYGDSVLDDGYAVSTHGHADMAAQVVTQLTESYDDVVLAGHSAGAETAISAVGINGAPVSALVAMGYHTYPDPLFIANDYAQNELDALQDDYVYFLSTPERRAEMFYTAENADPEVIAADTAAAVLTPSGEIITITYQPARIGSALVGVPTMLQLGEDDQLFPVEYAPFWEAQFLLAPSVTTDVVPGSAHTYMLHHEGPAAAERMADWIGGPAGLPGCVVPTGTAAPTPTPDPAPADESAAPTTATADQGSLPSTGSGAAGAALAVLMLGTVLRRRLA